MPVPSWGCLVPGVTAGTASTAHGSEGMDGPARLPQPCSLREEPALRGNSGSARALHPLADCAFSAWMLR